MSFPPVIGPVRRAPGSALTHSRIERLPNPSRLSAYALIATSSSHQPEAQATPGAINSQRSRLAAQPSPTPRRSDQRPTRGSRVTNDGASALIHSRATCGSEELRRSAISRPSSWSSSTSERSLRTAPGSPTSRAPCTPGQNPTVLHCAPGLGPRQHPSPSATWNGAHRLVSVSTQRRCVVWMSTI